LPASEKLFITGYARLPKGITATALYEVVGIGLIVVKKSGLILDADISLATSVGRDFFKSVIVGNYLTDIDYIVNKFEKSYLGNAKKAIISALKNAHDKYDEFKNNGFVDK
jgi:hypothetical protein